MRRIHLSSIGYVHGQLRRVADLQATTSVDLSSLIVDIENYRASELDVWQLAVAAARGTLATSDRPDLLIYVSENDPDVTGSLARIIDQLDLATIDHVCVSGHDCGNLGPSLRIAWDALHAGRCDRTMLILADRALAGRRVMASGMSVFSDGAASCIVTREPPDPVPARSDVGRQPDVGPQPNVGSQFEVNAVATKARVQLDAPADMTILSTAALARECVADILRDTGRERVEFRYVIFSNYRPTTQMFLTTAMGFPMDKLLVGPVTELGHCFSADLLVTLEQYRAESILCAGDRVLASTTGPYSWSTVAIQCR